MNENESVMVTFDIDYSLKSFSLPPEYEASPPEYRVDSTATAWIGGLQSPPENATTILTTYIYWI